MKKFQKILLFAFLLMIPLFSCASAKSKENKNQVEIKGRISAKGLAAFPKYFLESEDGKSYELSFTENSLSKDDAEKNTGYLLLVFGVFDEKKFVPQKIERAK